MGLRKEEIIQESITSVRTRTVIKVKVEGLLKIIIVLATLAHFKEEF